MPDILGSTESHTSFNINFLFLLWQVSTILGTKTLEIYFLKALCVWSPGGLGGVLCLESPKANIKVSAGLYSYLEALREIRFQVYLGCW